jgi:hypothetical protein
MGPPGLRCWQEHPHICQRRAVVGHQIKNNNKSLEALRALVDDVECAFEGEACADDGAFVEEASYKGDAVGNAARWIELGQSAAWVRSPVAAGLGYLDESGAHSERWVSGEVGDCEDLVAK